MNVLMPIQLPATESRGESSASKFNRKNWILHASLQISHRLGAVAVLAMLTAWAQLYLGKNVHIALATAGATAEAGLVFALLAKLLTGQQSPPRREANGVAIFNLILLIFALHLMVLTRLDVIRTSAGEFFRPSLPPQAENQW